MADYSAWEELVDRYLEKGQKASAVKLLFDLVSRYSKMQNFVKAEALRDKLFDVDPMALSEITKAAEIIEEEKSESIDQNHKQIWSDLYASLSADEANALFYAMEEVFFDPDHIVLNQSQLNSNLYFVDQGSLKLVYRQGRKEFLLKTLEQGTIAGEDTFFPIAVCTTSLITISRVTCHVLKRDSLKEWREKYSGLSSRLNDFCNKFENVNRLIKEKGLERRVYKRITAKGEIQAQILNASGSPVGKPFKGEMTDLSMGGVCFQIKASGHESARLLLGRKLKLKFMPPEDLSTNKIEQNATVVGVGYHLFNDYSIHIKFDALLDLAIT